MTSSILNFRRLGWLKKGSRDLFGTVRENNIYILIDSSTSMQNHLSFVKEKVRLLIQVGAPTDLSVSSYSQSS